MSEYPPTVHCTRLLVAALVAGFTAQSACAKQSQLPQSLTDNQFWTLAAELSEPAGTFEASDSLVSNETHFAEMVRLLGQRGGVYIGVGPEQNFSWFIGSEGMQRFPATLKNC